MTPEQQAEIARLDFDANTKETAARLTYQIQFATETFKALTLTNGGALIALFTLIGNLGGKAKGMVMIQPHLLWWAFAAFAFGLVCVLGAGIFAFFSQVQFYEASQRVAWNDQLAMAGEPPKYDVVDVVARGGQWMGAGVVGGCASLLFFLTGAAVALASVLPA